MKRKNPKVVSVHAAKTQLSRLLTEVERGAEYSIVRRGQPVAVLIASKNRNKPALRPRVGIATSSPVDYSEDAFAPLGKEELKLFGLE